MINKIINMFRCKAGFEFTPEELQELALKVSDLPLDQKWEAIFQELKHKHPGKLSKEICWIFNTAGNVVCQLAIIYGSPKEYVAFFGTPIGASGFSGRYKKSDVWDIMVQGEMLTYIPGQFEPTRYVLGDTAFLAKGAAKGFVYVDSTWMIDYVRGSVLSMFPFGVIVPTFYVTLDFKNALKQIRIYANLVFRSMFSI